MRKWLALALALLVPTIAFAAYRYNPYTGKLDYYEGGGGANPWEENQDAGGYDLTNLGLLTLGTNTTYKYYLTNRTYNTDVYVLYKIGATDGQMDGNPSDNTWQTTGGSTYKGTSLVQILLADDTSRSGITVTSNYTGILVKFILPAIDQTKYTALRPEILGYSSVNGIGMRSQIWDFNAGAWEVLATGSSYTDDDDLSATLTTNLANYIGTSNEVYLLVRNPNAGSGGGLFKVNMVRLGYKVDTDIADNIWGADLTILGDLSVGKAFRPSDIVPITDSAFDLGASDTYWDDIYVDKVNTGKINITNTSISSTSLNDSSNRSTAGDLWALNFGASGVSTNGIYLVLQDLSSATSDLVSRGGRFTTHAEGSDENAYSPTYIGVEGQASTSIFMSGEDSGYSGEVHNDIGIVADAYAEIFDEFESATYVGDFTQISLLAKEPTESSGDAYISGTIRRMSIVSQGDVLISSGKKLYLEGGWSSPNLTIGDTYIKFNSSQNRIEFYVNGTLAGHVDVATGFVND